MQLSANAQQIRDLISRLDSLNERNDPITGEPEHEIDAGELNRLKIALKPLVSDELQSRFIIVLNKMRSGSPITTSEAKLITVAFMSMADIVAGDPTLINRLRSDIKKYNDTEEDGVAPDADIAAGVNPELKVK
jgi:hypothetical protein